MLIQRLSKISELVNVTCYYKYFWCCTHTDTTPIRCFMLVFTIYACIISTVNSYNNFFFIILSNFSPNLVKINFAKFHRFLLPIWISYKINCLLSFHSNCRSWILFFLAKLGIQVYITEKESKFEMSCIVNHEHRNRKSNQVEQEADTSTIYPTKSLFISFYDIYTWST